jgi:hypothetical protein
MTKLESLADRPATKDDDGQYIYHKNGKTFVITSLFVNGNIRILNAFSLDSDGIVSKNGKYRFDDFYRQKPIVIAESEYNELKEKAWKYDELCK